MKICASPADTLCRYQRRLARDQADPGAAPDAYAALCSFSPTNSISDLPQAEQLLRSSSTERPRRRRPSDGCDGQRPARGGQRPFGQGQAEQYLFAKRFPGPPHSGRRLMSATTARR